MKRIFMITLAALSLVAIVGCSNWERTTYQTLAASQATINQAQADYQSGTIEQTRAAYTAINSAKAAQTTAVDTFVAYEEAKAAGGTAASLTAAQTDVTVALANLPTIIANVKALYIATGGK